MECTLPGYRQPFDILAETNLIRKKKAFFPKGKKAFLISGSPGRTRTSDKVVNSHLLYQLSYRGIMLVTNWICVWTAVKPAELFVAVKQFEFIHHDMGKCQWLDDRKMSHVSENVKFIIFSWRILLLSAINAFHLFINKWFAIRRLLLSRVGYV